MNQNQRMFIYFSELLNIAIIDKEEKFVGRLYDIVVGEGEIYPKAKSLIIAKGFLHRRYVTVSWNVIKERSRNFIQIDISLQQLCFDLPVNNREELNLKRDMIDQQVVDVNNHNIIRVNDIHLLVVEKDLMVAHVDIGARGLVRRLGFEKIVDFFVKIFKKNAAYLINEKLVTWKNIHPLSINPVSKTLKLNVSQRQLNEIHPADLSEIMLDLDLKKRIALFMSLDLKTKSAIFSHLDILEQKSILEELSDKEVVEIISCLPSDEAADLFEVLSKKFVNRILAGMETPKAKRLSTLLGYESESAGGLMTTEYFALLQNLTVGEALELIKLDTAKPESVQYMYIVDEQGQLLGSTNLRRLITIDPKENILKAKFRKNIFIYPEDGVKEITILMDKYKINVIPVINKEKILQGIITVDDILDHLINIAWRRRKKVKSTI